MTFLSALHPDGAQAVAERAKRHFAGPARHRREARFVTQDGEVLSVDLSVSPARDSQGTLLYGLAVMQNITVRKQAQRELAEWMDR